jgi:hypothetical protein
MKIKASLILSAVGVLKTMDTTEMKLSTSYRVKTLLSECERAIDGFESKRVKIAQTHGTLSEDKTHYEFTKEGSQEAFQKALSEMLEDEIDVDIVKLPLDLIDEYISIAPANTPFVKWFIEGLDS